jgi:2'-5' RNA ligase
MDVSESVIIAFYPSAADAQALALQAGNLPEGSEVTPPGQLHVTLCHLGQIDEMTQGEDVALRELANFASRMPIVHATVGGVGQFNNEDPQAIFAIIDSTYLQDWRRSLVYWVEDYFSIRRDYGFTPHCTLAYVPAGQPVSLPMLERREIVFDSVALSWGNRTTVFRLQGELREVTDDYEMTGNAKRSSAWDFIGRIAKTIGINLKSSESEVTVNEKDKLIAALVANTRCKFKEEELKKFDESQLKTLSESLAEPTQGLPAAEPPATPPATTAPAPQAPASAPETDPVATLTKEVGLLKGMIEGLTGKIQANADQEKAQIIAALVANQTTFTAEELGKMELPILQKMRLQFTPADYSLRGVPVANTGEWEDYKVPAPEVQTNGQGGAK